jgi:hypothetical protein
MSLPHTVIVANLQAATRRMFCHLAAGNLDKADAEIELIRDLATALRRPC